MSYYNERMQKVLAGRAGDWLSRRRHPYLTMLTATAIPCLAAWMLTDGFLQLGLHSMGVRFPLIVVIAYLIYGLITAAFIRSVPILGTEQLMDGAPDEIQSRDPLAQDLEWLEKVANQVQQAANQNHHGQGQALAIAALVTVLFGCLFVILWLIVFARWYLG